MPRGEGLAKKKKKGSRGQVEVATQGMLKGLAPQLEEGSTGGTYRQLP